MTKLRLPVTVTVGLGGSRDLYSVHDLLEFLDEWPAARRGPVRDQVRRTCLAALANEATPEQAREAFIAYAALMNVLEPSFEKIRSFDSAVANRSPSRAPSRSMR